MPGRESGIFVLFNDDRDLYGDHFLYNDHTHVHDQDDDGDHEPHKQVRVQCVPVEIQYSPERVVS